MNRFLDWLDDRSGIRVLVKEALYEKVPGGARWRYVWGSCLTFAFFDAPHAAATTILVLAALGIIAGIKFTILDKRTHYQ